MPLIGQVVLEEKMFENVDRQTTTDGRRTMGLWLRLAKNQFYFPVHLQDLKFEIYMKCPLYI